MAGQTISEASTIGGVPANGQVDTFWTVGIADDDPDIHTLTRSIFRGFTFEGRQVHFWHSYSGVETSRMMQEHPDTGVLLLDVVMESTTAGLETVRIIRGELGNHLVRIILRTGEADHIVEHEIIAAYDINDYKEKSDLKRGKLVTAVTAALRAYRDLRTIDRLVISNEELEQRIQDRTLALTEVNRDLRREITSRRQTEEELRKNRESLTRAQAIAHLGNWDWDMVRNEMTWSEEMYRIYGVQSGHILPSRNALLAAIHPEDRARVSEALDQGKHHCHGCNIEYRVVQPSGQVRSVHALGEVYLDLEGQPVRLVGTVHDITEMREAEDRLRIASLQFSNAMEQVEDNLRVVTKAFERAVEGVVVTDVTGTIQRINPAFTNITGYTEAEVIGKNPRILRSERQDEAFYRQMWDILTTTGQWEGEIWNRRKSGEAYPEFLAITAIHDSSSKVTNYVAVFHDLTQIKQTQDELLFKTYHDSLTGLPNRELFMDRLQQMINQCSRTQRKVLVVILDLDLFKNINNSMGHANGDRLLQDVTDRFLKVIRQGDTLSRLSGNTFGLIFPEVREVHDAVFLVRKLTNALLKPFDLAGHQCYLTASFGVTMGPDDGDDAISLIRNGEIAMNRAKEAGRDNCQFYTAVMGMQSSQRLILEADLRRAVEVGEFALVYQPKVSISTGMVVGMEALIRWIHPEGKIISPVEFIPLAEESGLIIPLGRWVMVTACRQTKAWLDAGFGPLRVAVNLSARQFLRKDIVFTVEGVLRESGLSPDFLDLEITESMVMGDVEGAIETLRALKGMGLRISIDDFGTGYSSLSYLKRFPIHTLKIDRSFVRDLATDSDDAAIVAAIISMARSLSLNVVAEGVETKDHLDFLRRNRCDEIQGYYFSKPLSVADFTKLLQEDRRLVVEESAEDGS